MTAVILVSATAAYSLAVQVAGGCGVNPLSQFAVAVVEAIGYPSRPVVASIPLEGVFETGSGYAVYRGCSPLPPLTALPQGSQAVFANTSPSTLWLREPFVFRVTTLTCPCVVVVVYYPANSTVWLGH